MAIAGDWCRDEEVYGSHDRGDGEEAGTGTQEEALRLVTWNSASDTEWIFLTRQQVTR